MTAMKILASALVALPLMARTGLSNDGEKYLAEAKKRIAKVEKEISADVADATKADAAKEDLLSSKRFLDNVQKEQPKSAEAAKLQAEADQLLAKLKPTLLKAEIQRSLDEVDGILGKIEKDLASASHDKGAEDLLMTRFEGVRTNLAAVLEKDPGNARALAEKSREDELYRKFEAQRAAKGTTP